MEKEELSKKLYELSDKINQIVNDYATGETIIEKFVNDLWSVHFKLNSLVYKNLNIIQSDPKLTRLSRTLFQELFKHINQHYKSQKDQADSEDELENN